MTLRIERGAFRSPVTIPRSKSHANRYLILAARSKSQITISHLPGSDDVQLLLSCLKKIGLNISHRDDSVTIQGSFPECEAPRSDTTYLDVGEGGTTARFLAALLSTGKGRYGLRTRGRLSQRPWRELTDALQQADASVTWKDQTLYVQGPVSILKLPTTISAVSTTQFASALQLAFYEDGYRVAPVNLMSSGPYWEMTKAACKEISSSSVLVPLDWSSAAYPLVFAAVTGQMLEIPNLVPDEQADAMIFHLLAQRGAASKTARGITGGALKDRSPIDVSVSQCPDLSVALAYLCATLTGDSILRQVSVLRQKESDRLEAIMDLLKHFGVASEYSFKGDLLRITGREISQKERVVAVPADHRMVMVGTLFLMSFGGGTISHPEAVAKSFPDFFDLIIRGQEPRCPKN